jgi:general secretion pathway protein K
LSNQLKNQKGAAIIVALFVVALVAAAAIAMIDRLNTDIRRTSLLLNSVTANFYAQGSVNWAIDQLVTDWQKQQHGHIIDPTPILQAPIKINGFKISGSLEDAQGRFNINNLKDIASQVMFLRMVHVLAPKLPNEQLQALLAGILEWITPASAHQNNPFSDYYAKLTNPYRSAHLPMVSASELLRVKGMTPALYSLLAPYLIALPAPIAININNAEAPVLMSLSPTLSFGAAQAIILQRRQIPFADTASFQKFAVVKNNNIPANNITTQSSYFLLRTDVTIDDQHAILYTLLLRSLQNSQPKVTIVWQSKGTL